MKFKALEATVKKQIKASMKRISQKLISLNVDKTDSLNFTVAFNIWKSRYTSTMNGNKYYDLVQVDNELFDDLRATMETVFERELNNKPADAVSVISASVADPAKKPATKKQLFYAKYLMDTVRNEPLPQKKYTVGEIGLLISDLKRQIRSS